ncbi:MAG TPA: type II secretion system minor pseudopilin GspK [Noviherbaspirillum sp.]
MTFCRPDRQRGVAVITALLLTTLAVTIVGSLFWQQQVQVRSIENQRLQLQKQWILRGALDWTRLILSEDKRISREVDHLGEPWAVPLAETRLDQYVEKERAGEVPDAALSGGIADANARFNLRNIYPKEATAPNEKEVAAFAQLLTNLQLNPSLAQATAALMASAQKKPDAGGGAPAMDASSPRPMNIEHVDDLMAVPGFTPEILAKLRDYVIVLPEVTKVNVNTALAEVLSAKIAKLTLSNAMALVSARQRKVITSTSDLNSGLLPPSVSVTGEEVDFGSKYFLVNGNVRLNRAGMQMQALMKRESNGATSVLWIREY